MRSVAFLSPFPYQDAILRPIYEHLANGVPKLFTRSPAAVEHARPDVVVVAELNNPSIWSALPGSLVVFTRHGFGANDFFATIAPYADFICISSEWFRGECIAHRWLPRLGYWVTGYPQADVLFARDVASATIQPLLGTGSQRLLLAPSFKAGISAAELVGEVWFEALRARFPDLAVWIKPHPHLPRDIPAAMDAWRRVAAKDPMVTLLDAQHANLYEVMRYADLLVTDASAAQFFFLALDRPILLVDNPARFTSENFMPDSYEWLWRDMGSRAGDLVTFLAAVEEALARPAALAATRARYRERVFGALADGSAAARCAGLLGELVKEECNAPPWVRSAWRSVGRRPDWLRAIARRDSLFAQLSANGASA